MPKCSKKAGIWLPKSAKKREKCLVIRSAEIAILMVLPPDLKPEILSGYYLTR